MKRLSALLLVVIMLLCVATPLFAFAFDASASAASDTPQASAQNGDNVNITVMIPQAEPEPTPVQAIPDPLPTPTPKPNPNPAYPALYPSDVYEFYDETSRQIIKTYELTDKENPAGISRDSFERDGWLYELTDITKKENAYASTREQTETATLETATKDTDSIIKLLAPTMEYKSDDGYIGVLTLDISSISVETAGTKKSSYTMTATREYPHLSSNDTSLVPKTITQNGVTYTLDSVSWQTQGAAAVDYDQIPTSYTANAKYTASGSKTTVTGYVTTASYVGTVSKILTGRTVYTAYFIGQKQRDAAPNDAHGAGRDDEFITEPTASEQSAAPSAIPEPSSPPVAENVSGDTPPESTAEPTPAPVADNDSGGSPWTVMLIVFALAIFGGGAYYFLRKNKNDKENKDDETTV